MSVANCESFWLAWTNLNPVTPTYLATQNCSDSARRDMLGLVTLLSDMLGLVTFVE